MFGWHVHEKAVLLVLVPLRYMSERVVLSLLTLYVQYSLIAAENHVYFRTFLLASCAGVFSLFPLLFTPAGRSVLCCRNSNGDKQSICRDVCKDRLLGPLGFLYI